MRGNALVGKPAIEMVTLAEYEHLSCAEREQIAILRVRASPRFSGMCCGRPGSRAYLIWTGDTWPCDGRSARAAGIGGRLPRGELAAVLAL